VADVARYTGQAVLYGLFALMIGYFSASPVYTHVDPGMAVIKLNFSHAGAPIRECRRFTPEELAKLAPNMRRPTDCPRERVPLYVELDIDGRTIFRRHLRPAGLAKDGSATVYQRFTVAPGTHRISVRMRDSRRDTGFDWTFDQETSIEARQNVAIDFRAETGGFRIL